MDTFTLRDFDTYFRHAWILTPDGDVAQIMGALQVSDQGKGMYAASLSKSGTKSDLFTKSLADIDWPNVAIPRLGYRNMAPYGKGLVYAVRSVGRVTHKGLSDNTVTIRAVPQVQIAMTSIGVAARDYTNLRMLNAVTANEIYHPKFVSLQEALQGLEHNPKAVGYALNHDFALVLGPHKHNMFVLLWKQREAAYSANGKTWTVYSKEYQDIIDRRIGKLLYE